MMNFLVTAKRTLKRVLPIAVVGARTNTRAILDITGTTSTFEIGGKRAARVGDKLIDPLDGEVTVISGIDEFTESDEAVAVPGSVLSNGSFIVEAGQSYLYWAELDDGTTTVFALTDDNHGD